MQPLEPRPPIALRLRVPWKFCRKRPGERLGGEDDSWCAWMAWAGKDREGGKEAGAAGGRDSPAWIPHSYRAACVRRAALRPRVLSPVCRANKSRKSSFQGKGLASRQDSHFFLPVCNWCREKNPLKLFKLTLCNIFFSLENTSREILNTSLLGFVGIYI